MSRFLVTHCSCHLHQSVIKTLVNFSEDCQNKKGGRESTSVTSQVYGIVLHRTFF